MIVHYIVLKIDSKNNNPVAHKAAFFIFTTLFSSHFLFSDLFGFFSTLVMCLVLLNF